VVNGESKRHARLNCISHLLSRIPYENLIPEPVELGPRPEPTGRRVRPPMEQQSFIPEPY
jgi:polyphosphate kinase